MKERVCCNCRHNIRTGEVGNIECHCDIGGHYIGYVECFEHWCRRWAKDHTFDIDRYGVESTPTWRGNIDGLNPYQEVKE